MLEQSVSASRGLTQRLEGLDAMQGFLADLAGAARSNLSIMTQALEPNLLHDENMIRRLAHFARKNSRNRVRVITCDTRRAEQRGHRLVTLAQQLPSYVEIRLLPAEIRQAYSVAQRTFVLADERHGFVWVNPLNPVATAYWEQPAQLRNEWRTFNTIWEQSQQAASLRRLGI